MKNILKNCIIHKLHNNLVKNNLRKLFLVFKFIIKTLFIKIIKNYFLKQFSKTIFKEVQNIRIFLVQPISSLGSSRRYV